MRKYLLTLSLVLMAFVGFSQIDFSVDPNQPTINIQRPTFSESATVLQGTPIQFENGALVPEEGDVAYNSFMRFRVNDRIELRSNTDWDTNFDIGAKVVLFNSDEAYFPDISVQSNFTQAGGQIMATDYRVAATFDNLVDNLGLTFNYGKMARFNGSNYFIATGSYQVLDRVTAFAEAQVRGEDVDYNFGFIALANNRWAVDIRGGSVAMGDESASFFGGGISFAVK